MGIRKIHYFLGETQSKLTKTACAPRNYGSHIEEVTSDWEDVNCAKCLKTLESDKPKGPSPQKELTPQQIDKMEREKTVKKLFSMAQNLMGWTPLWGSRDQRQAAVDLASTHSWEELAGLMEYAQSVRTQEFAPRIYSPYELWGKMTRLKDYSRRDEKPKK